MPTGLLPPDPFRGARWSTLVRILAEHAFYVKLHLADVPTVEGAENAVRTLGVELEGTTVQATAVVPNVECLWKNGYNHEEAIIKYLCSPRAMR